MITNLQMAFQKSAKSSLVTSVACGGAGVVGLWGGGTGVQDDSAMPAKGKGCVGALG